MKNKYFTKFCGITRIEDAKNAEIAGCDALGFVFVKQSKRYISAEKCQEIINSLAPMTLTVALFANNSRLEVAEILNKCSPHVLQFHGDESPRFCQQWQRPYWKAIPAADNTEAKAYAQRYPFAQAFLIDNYGKNKAGGSGKTFDWSKIPQDCDKKWILAGGLTPENIAFAKNKTNMTSFDVSSGIEQRAGIKSMRKMQLFIKNLKQKHD